MIQITAHMRIVAAVEPVDFRKGIDGLAAVCRQQLQSDPFSGALFVFVNKSKTARVMVYDGQGFWLCHKRLSKGRFLEFSRRNPHNLPPGSSRCFCGTAIRAILRPMIFADSKNF